MKSDNGYEEGGHWPAPNNRNFKKYTRSHCALDPAESQDNTMNDCPGRIGHSDGVEVEGGAVSY